MQFSETTYLKLALTIFTILYPVTVYLLWKPHTTTIIIKKKEPTSDEILSPKEIYSVKKAISDKYKRNKWINVVTRRIIRKTPENEKIYSFVDTKTYPAAGYVVPKSRPKMLAQLAHLN